MDNEKNITEKVAKASNGIIMLLVIIGGFILSTAALVFGIIELSNAGNFVLGGILLAIGIIGWIVFPIMCAGLKTLILMRH